MITAMLPPRRLGALTRLRILGRMLGIQAAWNYELLLGTGIGYCVEPALRQLDGGRDGPAYREALARECRYFNAHPYLAAIAVGALARAELDGEPPARIERFRTALCGPLGSVGDRLVWAAWLPFCSLVALAAFGAGAGPAAIVVLFLGLYNAGHLALRAWGLEVGWRRGLGVASALGTPLLRQAPPHIARAAALIAGFAVPLALYRIIGPGRALLGTVLIGAAIGALVVVQLHGRVEGWPIALVLLSLFVIYSVAL
jgi:PTS system mannose-specific IID component